MSQCYLTNSPPGILAGTEASPASASAPHKTTIAVGPPPVFSEADAVDACDKVMDLLALFFNVSGRQLRSPRRTSPPVARVRQIGMYIAHVSLGMKMKWVGAGFGRNKSTVVHACHTVEDMRDDEDFDRIVARTEALVIVAFAAAGEAGRRA